VAPPDVKVAGTQGLIVKTEEIVRMSGSSTAETKPSTQSGDTIGGGGAQYIHKTDKFKLQSYLVKSLKQERESGLVEGGVISTQCSKMFASKGLIVSEADVKKCLGELELRQLVEVVQKDGSDTGYFVKYKRD